MAIVFTVAISYHLLWRHVSTVELVVVVITQGGGAAGEGGGRGGGGAVVVALNGTCERRSESCAVYVDGYLLQVVLYCHTKMSRSIAAWRVWYRKGQTRNGVGLLVTRKAARRYSCGLLGIPIG